MENKSTLNQKLEYAICSEINGDAQNCIPDYCEECSFVLPDLREVIEAVHNLTDEYYKQEFITLLDKQVALTDEEMDKILDDGFPMNIEPTSKGHVHRIIQLSHTIQQLKDILEGK